MSRASLSVLLLALCAACTAPSEPDAGASDASAADARADVAVMRADAGVCEDNDNDGHPSAACGGDDCDDGDPRRNPGVREVCDNQGVDEDCDPCTVGERLPGGRGGDADRDEDGFASSVCFNTWRTARPTCAPVVMGDAGSFESVSVSDTEVRGRDCDDSTRTRNPAASERCDERLTDENCNGSVNEGCECPTVSEPAVSRRCVGASGECARGTQDCVDGRWSMCSIAPAAETCNDRDDNCDGAVDEGLRTQCYRDVDGDGLASSSTAGTRECGVADASGTLTCPAGFTAIAPMGASNSDCDDSAASGARRSPRLMEIPCNATDDDCNAATADTCPGGQACASNACSCPAGTQFCGGRCQTGSGPCTATTGACANPGVFVCNTAGVVACSATAPVPRAEVPCNGVDENCNGMADDSTCSVTGQSCVSGACACPSGQAACGGRCQMSGACAVFPASAYPGGYCESIGTYSCEAGVAVCVGVPPSGSLSIAMNGVDPRLSHACGRASGSFWMSANGECGQYTWLSYGPYVSLPRGRYTAQFRLSGTRSASSGSGIIDINRPGGGGAVASATWAVSGTAATVVSVTFDVIQPCAGLYEFRVQTGFLPAIDVQLEQIVVSRS